MKRIFSPMLSVLAILLSNGVMADEWCECKDCVYYIKLGSGVSFSESAHVVAPEPTWSPALQGYHSKLGNAAIAGVSLGCEYRHLLDVELGISTRSTFKYKKFQTSLELEESYTRKFDLDVVPILFSLNLLCQNFSYLTFDFCNGRLYPAIGAGIGVSHLFITNFRTTGLPPSGASAPHPSFSAENEYTHRKSFTYTVNIGLEYNYNDCWAISTGYRWFDAGKFKGPRYLRVSSGGAVDVEEDQWKMRFRANEWFLEFKIFL